MSKFVIIGSGALGSAFANLLIDAGHKNVCVFGVDQNELADLNQGQNQKYFGPDIKFNALATSNNLQVALQDASYIVLAIPSLVLEQVLDQINQFLKTEALIVNGCKGFYPQSQVSIHTGIENKTKNNPLIRGCVSIVGPSFAKEIITRSLTSICAVSNDLNLAQEVQKLFYTPYFKLYSQTDVIGAEVGGIYKNILAIGAGMLTQMGYKINTLAAFLTRGLNEMQTFNKFMGGKFETIYGLTGLGDLILTATDHNSRNFSFGFDFAKDPQILKEYQKQNKTLEGLYALEIVEAIRKQNQLYLPILAALYEIIHECKTIETEIIKLWSNELKQEKI